MQVCLNNTGTSFLAIKELVYKPASLYIRVAKNSTLLLSCKFSHTHTRCRYDTCTLLSAERDNYGVDSAKAVYKKNYNGTQDRYSF